MNLLKDYQSRVEIIYRTLESNEQAQRKQLNTLVKHLKSLNEQWMSSLSSAGLLGNYNFSKLLETFTIFFFYVKFYKAVKLTAL